MSRTCPGHILTGFRTKLTFFVFSFPGSKAVLWRPVSRGMVTIPGWSASATPSARNMAIAAGSLRKGRNDGWIWTRILPQTMDGNVGNPIIKPTIWGWYLPPKIIGDFRDCWLGCLLYFHWPIGTTCLSQTYFVAEDFLALSIKAFIYSPFSSSPVVCHYFDFLSLTCLGGFKTKISW